MSITVHLEPVKSGRLSRWAAKAAATALALGSLALVVLFIAFARTFVFEYFHGDHVAMQGLARIILGN